MGALHREIVETWHDTHRGRIQILGLSTRLRDEQETGMTAGDYAAACEQTQFIWAFAGACGLICAQDEHQHRQGSVRRAGLSGPATRISHCSDLHEDEITQVASTRTKIARNPSAITSTMGRCPHGELMAAGLRKPHLAPPNVSLHRLVCFANGNDVSCVAVTGCKGGGPTLTRQRC